MGHAAYTTVIKRSGIPTDFADEAMSQDANNPNLYRIDDATKQIWERTFALTVKDGGVVVDPSDYTVDYLFGYISFTAVPAGAVTVSGRYLPTIEIAWAQQHSINLGGDALDNSNYKDARTNGGFRTRRRGLNDVSVTLERFYDNNKDYVNFIRDREVVMVEISPGGSAATNVARGWFLVETGNKAGDINALETESLTFQLDGDPDSSFSWRDA